MIDGIETELGYDPSMGSFKSFWKKSVKAVGRVTRPFTSALASKILGPEGAKALAKLDPTDKNSIVGQMLNKGKITPAQAEALAPAPAGMDNKKVMLIAGAAALGLILLSKKR